MLDYFLVYFQVILLESISLITKFLTGRTARSQTEYYQRMLDLKHKVLIYKLLLMLEPVSVSSCPYSFFPGCLWSAVSNDVQS